MIKRVAELIGVPFVKSDATKVYGNSIKLW